MTTQRRIAAKKRGNRLGFWFFRASLQRFGLRGAYGLLYPVCLYYLLFDRAAVRGARAYIVRRIPTAGRLRQLWRIYRLFLNQGIQLIDRYAAMTGAVAFKFDLNGRDLIRSTVERAENGLVLLTAHVGNWQIAVNTLGNLGKTVHLVMRPEDNEAVRRALRLSVNTDHLRVISPESHLGGVLPIMNALATGDIVSFMGDRPFEFESMEIRFLGDTARFPCGAFQVAAAARCPILILLCARQGYRHYRIDSSRRLEPVYRKGIPKREQIRGWMQQYADILEDFVTAYPEQCFLFTDIWKQA